MARLFCRSASCALYAVTKSLYRSHVPQHASRRSWQCKHGDFIMVSPWHGRVELNNHPRGQSPLYYRYTTSVYNPQPESHGRVYQRAAFTGRGLCKSKEVKKEKAHLGVAGLYSPALSPTLIYRHKHLKPQPRTILYHI